MFLEHVFVWSLVFHHQAIGHLADLSDSLYQLSLQEAFKSSICYYCCEQLD